MHKHKYINTHTSTNTTYKRTSTFHKHSKHASITCMLKYDTHFLSSMLTSFGPSNVCLYHFFHMKIISGNSLQSFLLSLKPLF